LVVPRSIPITFDMPRDDTDPGRKIEWSIRQPTFGCG
jgi:hypothetical protein